ncbi:Replication factor RFC1 C terminal domain family protein [Candida albicans]|uniref:Replication factor C subunit 1 n=1 Tax=Candida albicans TaxID=5476 RepID=A0A8H6BWA8_CANAX|nr:Replication factor RFC1 C terminal domain family protein [Candida albicans]
MVNISDFFKNNSQSGSKRKAQSATSSNPTKKAKPAAPQAEREVIVLDDEDDDDDDVKASAINDEDDDDDDDDTRNKSHVQRSPKKETASSVPKASPKKKTSSTLKSTAATKKSKVPAGGDSTADTAQEILATIPDAELPEVDPTKKVNFFALNAAHRGTAEQTAKQYGAKVTKSISGKTSLVVLGADAGPSKVQKIKQHKIKAIDEAGFIKLLESMPADGGSGAAAEAAKLKREQEEAKSLNKQRRKREKKERSKKLESQKESKRQSTQRHAPTDLNQLCGNKGQIQKLKSWLENWFDNQARGFKGNASDPDSFRAVLISGPPGIGKTSAAHLVAKSLGFDIIERNASDVRSKSLLNANVKSILNNTSVVGYFKHRGDTEKNSNNKRFCIIMDEVDGMSSGDHGGAGALSQFCKITSMPMILICNDKSLPKMRTFDRTTYDLPFRRPSENEVKSRLMTIAFREKVKLDPSVIGQLVQATSNDIRQMINLLSTVSKTQKQIGANSMKEVKESWQKQVVLKPFDIAGRLLNSGIWSDPRSSLNDKLNLYFNDFDFSPLMIQENYLITNPRLPGKQIELVATAAEDISISDTVNSLIRSGEQQWSLLPFHGIMSTVKPSYEIAGQITGRLNFSSWLGQNSKQMKYQRMLQELQYHTRVRTSTTKQELRLDYLDALWQKIVKPLCDSGEDGFDEAIETMDEYYLTKEDFDNIGDMIKQDLKLPTQSKSAFTRKYNSMMHPTIIFKTGNSLNVGGKRAAAPKVDFEDVIDDDMEDVPDDDEDQDSDKIDTKKDKLIKVVPVGKSKSKSKSKASTVPAKKKQKR